MYIRYFLFVQYIRSNRCTGTIIAYHRHTKKLDAPEVAELSEDALHAGYDVVHEPACDPLVHGGVLLRAGLDVEEPDQGLDGDALNEHGPVDDGDRSSHEHGRVRHFLKNETGKHTYSD